jgi:uncharacterized protein
MDSEVYFVPVTAGDTTSSLADKSVRIFRESGLDRIFGKEQIVAVKQHFGEQKDGHYIKPPITAALVRVLNERGCRPFLTDTATLYSGGRSDGIAHGFTPEVVGAPFIAADGIRGIDSMPVPIAGKHFTEVRIASAVYHADAALVLTHVTGHCQIGYGGAIKNVAMGMVPRSAKLLQHFQAVPRQNYSRCTACGACIRWCPAGAIEWVTEKNRRHACIDAEKCIGCGECLAFCRFGAMGFNWSLSGPTFAERTVEHALGYVRIKRDTTAYLNYALEITRDCDCVRTERPELAAVGILAGRDVLALEQATIDLINEKTGNDFFAGLWPGYDYAAQLAYAETLGLGTRKYTLVRL